MPKVLYLHGTGFFGGASKSLMTSIQELKTLGYETHVLTPEGTFVEQLKWNQINYTVVPHVCFFDHTDNSYYQGLRWVLLLRELYRWFSFFLFSRQFNFQSFDIIHVNDLTLLPSAYLISKQSDQPMVCHVRSLQRIARGGMRAKWIIRWTKKLFKEVICIDQTVGRSLAGKIPHKVVHNSLYVNQGGGKNKLELQGRNGALKVGFVGHFLPFKGIIEFVKSAFLLKDEKMDFYVFGDNIRNPKGFKKFLFSILGFHRDLKQEVQNLVLQYNLENVHLMGFVNEMNEVYEFLDVLVFPSTLKAPGRPVFEAAFYKVPSVLAIEDPTADTFVPGVTGISIKMGSPEAIAKALIEMTKDKERMKSMGNEARALAEAHFRPQINGAKLKSIYESLTIPK